MFRNHTAAFKWLALAPLLITLSAATTLAASVPTDSQKAAAAAAMKLPGYRGAEHFGVVEPQLTRPLGSLQPVPAWRAGDPIRFVPKRIYPAAPVVAPVNPVINNGDPLLDLQRTAVRGPGSLTTALNVAGQNFTGPSPPDTVGDVGPNHYVQMVNSSGGSNVQIFDKALNSVQGPYTLDTLITSGVCGDGAGDPVVLYDQLADRWLLSEFSNAANALCVYVSQSPDPTGAYWRYTFPTPNFPDYPKYGVWPDAYYVGTNEGVGSPVYALQRPTMLVGATTSFQRLTAPDLSGFGFQVLQPADLDGAAPPPAGAPGLYARHRDDERHNPGSNNPNNDFIELWAYDVDFAIPANSTFTQIANVPIAEIDSDLCGFFSFNCFQQPNGQRLDPLREVVMHRLAYRNFGAHQTLVGNLVTDVSGSDQGGVRWFELRNTGGGWTNFNEGTHAPDTDNRWMGSIAMDQSGNIALGYSVSSLFEAPDIRYTGRRAGDPAGVMSQGDQLIINGTGSQGNERWGDYAAMSIDPADDCTFWFTTEFVNSNGTWNTRIATMSFDTCGGPGPFCGDGMIDGAEQCDDGNMGDGDGCSANCTIEPGFSCTGEPSVCTASGTCLAQDFDPIQPGWTIFNVGAIPWNWGVTNDFVCFSGNLSGAGVPPAPNVTGGAGEAACIDSDAAGNGVVEAYLCSPAFFAGNGTIDLDFLYNYQIFQTADSNDFFSVRVGTAPPNAATIAGYALEFSTFMNGGAFNALPGVAQNVDLSIHSGSTLHVCFGYGGNFDWYAQVDNVTVTASGGCGGGGDADGDGIPDSTDNCIEVFNPTQQDSNGDGIGNICDADIARPGDLLGDCAVNFADLDRMKAVFFTNDPDANLDSIGNVNFADLDIMKASFFGPPGPSANGCTPGT